MKRVTTLLTILLVLSGCGGLGLGENLGLGEADCESVELDVSSSNILSLQAVPNAKYTPCVNELRLGWERADWFAESGRAGIEIIGFIPSSTFLTATVTESCDVSEAVAVESSYPDIERFEDIELESADIEISIIPSAEQPLSQALLLVDRLSGVEIDNRPVTYVVDDSIDESVSERVDRALAEHKYVFIIDEVDAEEGTVQLRGNLPGGTGHDLSPEAALDVIGEAVPDVFYRGNWYFTFEGGCITYEFDAEGLLAETIAQDAEESLGFYPAGELRRLATDAGFNLG